MEPSALAAMLAFSLAMSITPGPVNMVILSSGLNYGLRKTIGFVSGATIGFTLLLLCVGLGFYKFIQVYPGFLSYLAIGGSIYIAYIGYKIASSKPDIAITEQKIPQFMQGFILQWLNPKAWIACVSGVSLFSQVDSYNPLMTFSGIYFLVCYGSLSLWAILGQQLSVVVKNNQNLRMLNVVMGSILIITSVYLGYSNIYPL